MMAVDESTNFTSRQWHLDRRVPLALIIAIVLQTGSFIWWAARTDARVDALEISNNRSSPQIERIVRLETKMDGVVDSLKEIKDLMRQALNPPPATNR